MANAIIGALRVNLGLDSANFQTGLKKSQGNLEKFATAVKVGFAAAAAAAAGAFSAIQMAATRADDMWKASQSLGVPIDELGRLRHAAEMSGASFEMLSTGLRRGTQAIAQAAQGASNEATGAFDAMGISVKNADGMMRSVSDVIGDVAEQFSQMPDGVQKTNAAIAIFGRSGAGLIPTLNAGRQGLKDMGDEAERLGLVFDERTARASERFNDNISRLTASFNGLWNRVLAGVIPAFDNLSARLVAVSQNGQVLDGIVMGISAAMNVLARGITFVFDNLQHLYDLLKVFVAAKAVTYVVALGGAFISLARTVRVAGLAMALVTSITRAKITTIALLAAVIAKLTGQYDNLAGFLSSVGQSIMNALPEIVKTGVDGLAQSLKDLAFGIEEADGAAAASFGSYLGAANEAAAFFGNVGSKARSAANGAKDAWAGLRDVTADTTRQMNQAEMAGESFGQTLASSLQGLFDGSKKFSDVLKDIASQLANMALSNALKAIFGGLFGGASGGGFLSSIFGGFRADGGPVAAGRAYVVGERGPELMVPGRSGTVIPNDALRSSSGRGGPSEVMVRGVFVDDGGVIKARIDETVTAGISEYDQTMPERIGGQMNQARRIGAI